VCVVLGEPGEQILTKPPLICIEILSRDDRMSRLEERIDDYLAMVSGERLKQPRCRPRRLDQFHSFHVPK